jgi:hypothetical protein
MKELYSISLENISIEDYRETLEKADLLPGRMILKNNLDRNFKLFKEQKLKDLQELSAAIKTEDKRKSIAKRTGIGEEYLTILRREINGFVSKPINLSDFPEIDKTTVARLLKIGIKTSKALFENGLSKSDRRKLSETSGVDYESILVLTKLSDLGRVNGVGPVFARMLYESGCDTVKKLSKANGEALFEKLQTVNQKRNYTKAKFTIKDMAWCVRFAAKLPHSVVYDKKEE